jgi:asparagine synthase (glutamine-hydrolysing)
MMNGVEVRMPFLDYRILQFAFSIPYSSKIRNGYTKAIIRDALKGILPEKIQKRKSKIGFNSPTDVWVRRNKFKEWLNDQMNSGDFKNSSVVNPAEVKKSINDLINQNNVTLFSGSQLFEKIIPYIWEKGLKLYVG